MPRSLIRQCIAYLLIALLPLQAAAASRLALCAQMSETIVRAAPPHVEHCAQMGSMPAQSIDKTAKPSTDKSPASQPSACWFGSMCIAGLMLMAVPASYADVHIARDTPLYFSLPTFYRSIISDNPLRPPATI